MNILVLTHQHGLLPWAWKLRREGHEVEVCVWSERYEAAWGGRLDKCITGTSADKAVALTPYIERARLGELTVLTDFDRGTQLFAGCPRLFGVVEGPRWAAPPRMMLVGWFDGEAWHGQRWAVPDWGAWPGGLGPPTMGAATLFAPRQCPPVLDAFTDPLKSMSFRGLVVVGLDYFEAAKELVPTGIIAGWPAVVGHGWLGYLGDLGRLLGGEGVEVGSDYTVSLPVSQPPWPVHGAPGPEPVQIPINRDVTQHVYFHDVEMRGSELWTAGLNGLIGVVVCNGRTVFSAQSRAQRVADALPLPEKQYRSDVGGAVPARLIALEELGYV